MNVLKEYKGYQLVERYDKTYIRFWGGREEDMPCEFPVSKTDAERVISKASVIDELLSIAKTQIKWTANSFYKIGITEYILHCMKFSQTRAEKAYEKIAKHADIRKEFYQYIMNDEAFTPNPIKVEGFTAQYLVDNYPFSVLGAYNYLIYLREMPEEALADLKAGLPIKDSSQIEVATNYEEYFQIFRKTGMFHYGVKKDFQGKVDKSTFFSIPGLIVNTFGYYQNNEETWIVFVTDGERGIEITRKELPTEEAAIEYLIELCKSHNFDYYSNTVMENFEEKEPIIIEYLKTEYSYSDAKARKALDYLLQVKFIAFEFLYFIENGNFVSDKYANVFSGYTAKRILTETDLTILGAFNYMVFLKQNPDEALLNLKRGLPRRKDYSEKDLDIQ